MEAISEVWSRHLFQGFFLFSVSIVERGVHLYTFIHIKTWTDTITLTRTNTASVVQHGEIMKIQIINKTSFTHSHVVQYNFIHFSHETQKKMFLHTNLFYGFRMLFVIFEA